MVLGCLRLETQSTTTGLMAKHCYTASPLSMVSSHFSIYTISSLLLLAWEFSYINPNSHTLLVITTGRVTYQSRYLRSETYHRNMAANKIVVSEFGTVAYPDPCKTIFQR